MTGSPKSVEAKERAVCPKVLVGHDTSERTLASEVEMHCRITLEPISAGIIEKTDQYVGGFDPTRRAGQCGKSTRSDHRYRSPADRGRRSRVLRPPPTSNRLPPDEHGPDRFVAGKMPAVSS